MVVPLLILLSRTRFVEIAELPRRFQVHRDQEGKRHEAAFVKGYRKIAFSQWLNNSIAPGIDVLYLSGI